MSWRLAGVGHRSLTNWPGAEHADLDGRKALPKGETWPLRARVVELLGMVKIHLKTKSWRHHGAKHAHDTTNKRSATVLLSGADADADIVSKAMLTLLVFNATGNATTLLRLDATKHHGGEALVDLWDGPRRQLRRVPRPEDNLDHQPLVALDRRQTRQERTCRALRR